MKIKRLQLENYRGFEEVDIDLNGDPALIIGKNGVGKSTILDAIATVLAPLYKEFLQEKTQTLTIDELDVRIGETKAKITLDLEYGDTIYQWDSIRDLEKSKQRIAKSVSVSLLADRLREVVVQNQLAEEKDESPRHSIPIMAYYPANREVMDVSGFRVNLAKVSRSRLQSLTAWEEALSVGVNFQAFFNWFRNQEDIENEKRRYDYPEYVDPKLQAVRNAIESFLPNFRNLRYTRVSVERMLVDKNGMTFAVNQLSSGEKMILTVVGDLARRLAIANPGLEDPLNGEGLVLIDEVEAHLHPGWQRLIINGFRSAFPNIQFLFTTHSPQVISEVRDLKMYVLNSEEGRNTVKVRKPVFGQDINYILEVLMDTDFRNKDVKQSLYRIFSLLEHGKLDEAQLELIALEKVLEGFEKPADMVKAENTLIRKRSIGI